MKTNKKQSTYHRITHIYFATLEIKKNISRQNIFDNLD